MRILVDLQPCQSASRGRGIGRYSLALAEAFVPIAGAHELSLLLNAAFPDSVESLRERFRGAIPDERIHVFAVPVPVAEIDPANCWRARAAEAIREADVCALRPDVVLLSSLFEGFVDDATTSILAAPDRVAAATLYDLIPLIRPGVLATPQARAWYDRKLAALRRADLLLAISEHARAEAHAALGIPADRIAVISTAADACFRPPTIGEKALCEMRARHGITGPYALYAGGFDERKNVRNLIVAYATLSPDIRGNHQLVLVGHIDEHERGELRRTGERVGLRATELLFTGYADDADLAALYGDCAVFAFPSLHEGFGLPVLEAMSCGAAVIGSNTTSIPEVIARDDALFDPTDIGAIGGRLHAVLTNLDLRSELQRHGLARAAEFSWEATARRACDALGDAHARKTRAASKATSPTAPANRPTLAFVSPLPPERTGIAFYSAELLAALQKHYRIELVTDQKTVELPAELRELPVRATEWFDAHANWYDRTLYQFGNSPFHRQMFGLLERHPGTIVLHDVHVGGVLNWMDVHGIEPGIYSRALFESHGYAGLIAERDLGREAAIDTYACSWRLLEDANGIIVHSVHAMDLASQSFRIHSEDWRRIPQVRRLPDLVGRQAARHALGVAPDELLFCSFGFIDPTKQDDRILDAWLASPLAADPRCSFTFVGENHGGDYGKRLRCRMAASSARTHVTGYVDAATFGGYLLAADAAIQLRGITRGETSRTVLDCLAHGIPLVTNASGSLGELPDDVLMRMPDDFSEAALADALTLLASDAGIRERLRRNARQYIASDRDPVRVAAALRDALEYFADNGRRARYARLVRSVATIDVEPTPEPMDWRAAAQSIAINLRRPAARQLFVDISILASQDLRTGIERVVRAVLRELIERAPDGFRVEPVIAAHQCYVYARRFTCQWLDLPADIAEDTPIDVAPGDVFIGLDWAANIVPDQEPVLQRYRTLGVMVTFVVYDLLPILRPDFYPPGIDAMHGAWLRAVANVSDGVLCISSTVADEFVGWLQAHGPQRVSALNIGVLPLGADLERSLPSKGLPAGSNSALEAIASRPSALIVGTVEPRKGHAQALAAFESLWRGGADWNLVVVGKQGWMVDELADRMRGHREQGHRLFWYEGASDEWLDMLYANVDVLLAASLGEGYGLPLIEAARHGVPLLLRDLPVFREVAGEHATYFSGPSPDVLARALTAWKRAADDAEHSRFHAHQREALARHRRCAPVRDSRRPMVA